MAPTPKWTKGQKRTKPNSANKSFSQVVRKPTESIQSEVFKMKRIFIRTFSTIDLIIQEKFGKNIIEFVNELDTPSKEKLQSSNSMICSVKWTPRLEQSSNLLNRSL